jgi:predicted ester cyclase
MSRESVLAVYERYNATCNRHAFDELAEFVHPVIRVNGAARTLQDYADGLFEAHRAFLFEEPWLAMHFRDEGTHLGPWHGVAPRGKPVTTDEFSMYRFEDGRIAEVWVTADNARLPLEVRGRPAPAACRAPGG